MFINPGRGIGKNRIEALADGIFAIAMTLLILNLKVPDATQFETNGDLSLELLRLWPKFMSYIASFLIVGVFWVGHHATLHHVKRADRIFIWLNLFFLLFISAMPFSAALLSEHYQLTIAVVIYCANLIVTGLIQYAMLQYGSGRANLFTNDFDAKALSAAGQRILLGPTLYSLALVLAFIHTTMSLVICVIVPLLYILPGRVDRHWATEDKTNS